MRYGWVLRMREAATPSRCLSVPFYLFFLIYPLFESQILSKFTPLIAETSHPIENIYFPLFLRPTPENPQ